VAVAAVDLSRAAEEDFAVVEEDSAVEGMDRQATHLVAEDRE
jgi:hypothetical protein